MDLVYYYTLFNGNNKECVSYCTELSDLGAQ